MAFRCKGRHFCPSCDARRLSEWSLWLDEELLAPVAHRHVVLTLPTDGAFRRDGTFVALPEPEAAVLEALWQRVVLAEFVRQGWLEDEAASAMLAWPHSGFGAHVGPRIDEREGQLRVARDAARSPVAESRLRYDAERAEVELVAAPAAAADAPEPAGDWPALRARWRGWAELLRLVFRVDVERGVRCGCDSSKRTGVDRGPRARRCWGPHGVAAGHDATPACGARWWRTA